MRARTAPSGATSETRPEFGAAPHLGDQERSVLDGEMQVSNNLAGNAPGALLRYETAQGAPLISNLARPTSMAVDESAGLLYISTLADGKIVSTSIR